ncbi:hypothetical protein E2C01_092626 [Portunus trituberculatus]|uniref:Uncharacterized protein n=1 Tax=Portunus trituberculatus TaxID=210409 RepID=A0A5B7JRW4_PORTR|nr:hypothetical protein [Portunus trituberculatus]
MADTESTRTEEDQMRGEMKEGCERKAEGGSRGQGRRRGREHWEGIAIFQQ